MSSPRSADAIHRSAWDLIPWVVNGRASAAELELVDHHARVCEACSEELEYQRRLHFAMALESGKTRDPVAGFHQLRRRIERSSGAARAIDDDLNGSARRSSRYGLAMRALVAAVIIETSGLVVLGGALLSPGDSRTGSSSYRTLTAPSSSSQTATIRVVWAPTTTVEQMQAVLRRLNLEVVSGPTEASVYSLSPLTQKYDLDHQLAQLRADGNIRFAESVPSSAAGP